ncbi:MAG: HU family DNA-binding protein [Schwartzia sp.]|nr:HU family DNA-binding protein [Schwartzia sp. (in: firmicutes)]
MKKADFIKETAAQAGVSQKDAQAVVAAAIEVIKGSLKKGDTVPFLGFGTFKISDRAARTGRNPQTGEEIKIAAAKLPTFKASPAFKEFVNAKKAAAAPKKAPAKKKK